MFFGSQWPSLLPSSCTSSHLPPAERRDGTGEQVELGALPGPLAVVLAVLGDQLVLLARKVGPGEASVADLPGGQVEEREPVVVRGAGDTARVGRAPAGRRFGGAERVGPWRCWTTQASSITRP